MKSTYTHKKSSPLPPERVRALLKTPPPAPPPPKKGRGGPRGKLFRAVVPDATIRAIRAARDRGERVLDIAAAHGVSGAYVSMLTNGLRRRAGKEVAP